MRNDFWNVPIYPDDSDYTTNSPSYYDDLARKNKLIQILAKKIMEYDKELGKRFEEWDKNLQEFPEDVKDLLEKWLNDGTLDHIINDTIFNWKADKTFVDSEIERLDLKDENLTTQLTQIAISAKNPPAPFDGVKGDGITDDTNNLQLLINATISNGWRLNIPIGKYLITDTIMVDYDDSQAFSIMGENKNKTVFLGKMTDKPMFKFVTVNDGELDTRVDVSSFNIKPFNESYKFMFDGIVVEHAIANHYSGITMTTLRHGLVLQNNDGYTEQNIFEDMYIVDCKYNLTFRSISGAWDSSFHGNVFERFFVTATTSTTSDPKIGVNIESGYVYNCIFNLKMFFSGPKAYMFYINGGGATNAGNISYEIFGNDLPKIKTGENADALFFLEGNIYGFNGDIDWSEYKPISVGELQYSNNKIPLPTSSGRIGREKFFANNLLPRKEVTQINKSGKNTVIRPLTDTLSDMWQGQTHKLVKYQNANGAQENGFIMAGKQQFSNEGRFITGVIPFEKNDIKDLELGFEMSLGGDYLKSVKHGSTLNFGSDNLKRDDRIIYDTGTVKVSASNGYFKLPMHSGTSALDYIVEKWGFVEVTTTGDTDYMVDLTGYFDQLYNVQVTFNQYGETFQNNSCYVVGATTAGFRIMSRSEGKGRIYWRATGYQHIE